MVLRRVEKIYAFQVFITLFRMGIEQANASFYDIQRCIIKSMKAVQKLVTNCPQSFELYGFDFIFDSKGKAWLL